MAHTPVSATQALEQARTLLATIRGAPLTDEGLTRAASELAGYLLILSRGLETRADAKRNASLARLMSDRRGQLFSTLLTDRVPRLKSGADIVRQAMNVLRHTGIPTSMPGLDRLQLKALELVGPWLPSVVGAGVRRRIHDEAEPFLIPGEPGALAAAVRELKGPGVRVNVNQLGEEVLGHAEAERHMAAYLRLLETPEVDTVSVKVSSICAQLSVLAWDDSFGRVCQALERLYRAAQGDGTSAPKRVMLDMEAYRDLELTHRAFVNVLARPEFTELEAGIVLQAYLPDSHAVQSDLIQWARARCESGGAPIHMRIVKGANLAVERIEASQQDWELPIYPDKPTVDASFKAMVERGLEPESVAAVNLGVASHNLFDVAHALVLASRHALKREVHFEVLAGMAGPLSRALQHLDQDVLVYSPAVSEAHFHSAVAYLVRRLDENTAEENFLRHSFDMAFGDAAWEWQLAGYHDSRRIQRTLSTEPRRQPRFARDEALPSTGGTFANAEDTDFVHRAHRNWIREHLDRMSSQAPPHLPLYIGGEALVRPASDGFDPSRPGAVPYRMSLATEADVKTAIETGQATQARWSAVSVAERANLLRQAAAGLRAARGELIAALVMDGGKSVTDADAEVSEAIDFGTYYADTFEALAADSDIDLTPRGLTVVTPPWNFPLAIPLGGAFAALVAGNPVILKPARETVFVATRAVEICHRAGIPTDALQLVVATDDVATELITHPAVQVVVLTGGTETARLFKRLRPDLHLLAETGGKNATIVSRFADRDVAVDAIVQSAFGHAGQKCSATSLLILTPELAEDPRFVEQLVDAARSMHVGAAWDLASRVTPMIHPPEGALHTALTTLGEGETWWLEPKPSPDNPRLWSPGIKAGVAPGSFSHLTEFFGPVLSVLVARDLEQAITWANATPYGLTAGFHSLDEGEQRTFLAGMNAGNLYVNRTTTGAIVQRQPFGGRKASCFGPGAKAGGPNYVAQFVHIADASPAPPAEVTLSPMAEHLVQAIGSGLRPTAHRYAAEVEARFNQLQDPAALRGQDNVFRYQFHTPMLLVAFPGARQVDVARAALAMVTLGVRFQICTTGGVDLSALRSAFERGVVHDGPWDARFEVSTFGRMRAIGTVPQSAYELANQHVAHVDTSPVVEHARTELGKYVVEQSVSVDYHRYGHLGLRELDEDAAS